MPSFFKKDIFLWICVIAIIVVAFPDFSLASGITNVNNPQGGGLGRTTFGQLICNVRNSGNTYPNFLSALAYVIGAFLILRGALALKKNSDAPSQTSPVVGITLLITGALLLALPSFAGVIIETVFGVASAGGGGSGCNPGATGGAVGLDTMMKNFVDNIHNPIFSLVAVLGYIIGATYIFIGLMRMSKIGTDPRASNPKDIIVYLVIGSVLMSIASVLTIILNSVFGFGTLSNMSNFSGISWSGIVGSGANTAAADNTIKAILAFVQIVGVIAFLRGWLIIKRAAEGGGQATIPQGVTHIIGGAMAINIDIMLKIFDKTFGTGLLK